MVDKREEDGRYLVDLELSMMSQRDIETAYATATVSLPSRERRAAAACRRVPVDLERQAATMFARHNELTAQKRGMR